MSYVYRQPPHVQFRQRVFPYLLASVFAVSITEGARAGDTFASTLERPFDAIPRRQLASTFHLYEERMHVGIADDAKTFVYQVPLVQTGSITEGAKAGDTFAGVQISTPLFLKSQLAPRWQLYEDRLDVPVLDLKTVILPEGTIQTGSITEGAKAGDTQAGVGDFVGAITEGAKAGDTEAANGDFVGSVSEGAKAGDTFGGVVVVPPYSGGVAAPTLVYGGGVDEPTLVYGGGVAEPTVVYGGGVAPPEPT